MQSANTSGAARGGGRRLPVSLIIQAMAFIGSPILGSLPLLEKIREFRRSFLAYTLACNVTPAKLWFSLHHLELELAVVWAVDLPS